MQNNKTITYYIQKQKLLYELTILEDYFKTTGINKKELNDLISSQLLPIELLIFNSFVNDNKSLKKIAVEQNLSYSYIRKRYSDSKKKVAIIINILEKKGN